MLACIVECRDCGVPVAITQGIQRWVNVQPKVPGTTEVEVRYVCKDCHRAEYDRMFKETYD